MTHLTHHQLVYIPDEGHLVFKVWSRDAACYRRFVLSAQHTCAAFGIKNMSGISAFNSMGIARRIIEYVDSLNPEVFIFALMIDGRDALKELREYIRTLEISDNVSPRVIEVLYHFHKKKDVSAGAIDFYIIDYDMKELRFRREENIHPRM